MGSEGGYDYIVVGGGSAGCKIAGRLADAGRRVLLVEAGPSDRNPLLRMPAGYIKLLGTERYMWFYKSVVQDQLFGRTPIVPQGRVLGGGSSVNAMVYMRGQPIDFDRWAEATGDTQWGFAALLPYFTGMEDNERLNNVYHGVGGPWKVSDPVHTCELSRAFVLAIQAAGLPFNSDFNGPSQRGVGMYQVNARNGRRCSAASAFLATARRKGTLRIETDCLVQRVLIEHGRAVGVRYSRGGGKIVETRCSGEVILTAGAIATPKILMLSGIGPSEHLRAHGIETMIDLPGVGRNFHDHPEIPVLAFCNGPYGYFGHDKGFRQIRNGIEYLLSRSGPATSNGVEAGAFFDPENLSGDPKVQTFCVPSVFLDKDQTGLAPQHGLTLTSCLLQPQSRGSIRLASARPDDQPIVDPRYMEHSEDLRLAVSAVRRAREFLQQQPLSGMIEREVFPGPAVNAHDEIADYVRRFVKTVYHPVGTCRMGKASDAQAVIGADLRVRGLEGLMVADASAMPNIVSGNTNAAVLVIADKAADQLLGNARRAPADFESRATAEKSPAGEISEFSALRSQAFSPAETAHSTSHLGDAI